VTGPRVERRVRAVLERELRPAGRVRAGPQAGKAGEVTDGSNRIGRGGAGSDGRARDRTCQRRISRTSIRPTALRACASLARSSRSSKGTLSTHWRTGTSGRTWSVKWAAVAHMRRALHEGTNAAPLARERYEQLRTARRAWRAKESVGVDAALQIGPELALDVSGQATLVLFARRREEAFKVGSDDRVKRRRLGSALFVTKAIANAARRAHRSASAKRVPVGSAPAPSQKCRRESRTPRCDEHRISGGQLASGGRTGQGHAALLSKTNHTPVVSRSTCLPGPSWELLVKKYCSGSRNSAAKVARVAGYD
jgi:hypothetical protein